MTTIDFCDFDARDAHLMMDIVADVRPELDTITTELYEVLPDTSAWLVSSVLSRNVYLSRILRTLCYLELIRRRADEGPLRVRNAPEEVARILRTDAQPGVVLETTRPDWVHSVWGILTDLGKIFLLIFQAWLARRPRNPVPDRVILIDTFWIHSMFKHGTIADRYFQGLLESSRPDVRSRIHFIPEVMAYGSHRTMRRFADSSDYPYLFKADYLTLGDHLISLIELARRPWPRSIRLVFRGFDVSDLFRRDHSRHRFNPGQYRALCTERVIFRLMEADVRVSHVVDWSENQPFDRIFCRAVRQAYPNVTIHGYQGFVDWSDVSGHLSPIEAEVDRNLIPDRIFVPGPWLVPLVTRNTIRAVAESGPAIRFSHIHRAIVEPPPENEVNVLVALPIADEGMQSVIQACGDLTGRAGFSVVVKPHPTVSLSRVRRHLARNDCRWAIDFGAFDELLAQANILVSSSSSVCVEALAMNRPVIVVGSRNDLTHVPIPPRVDVNLWRLCFSAAEVTHAVRELLGARPSIDAYAAVRDGCFNPVTPESVDRLLASSYCEGGKKSESIDDGAAKSG